MARVITTVRHAATANTRGQVITGRLDEPLSDEGRAQACSFVSAFGVLEADAVLSSPLRRAWETARLVTGLEANAIEPCEACIDRDYGLLQGISPEEVELWRPQIEYIRAGGIEHSVNPPGGETLAAVRARAEGLAEALRSRPEARILVVSHQLPIQQLQGALMGVSLHAALAIDIRVLQVDELALRDGVGAIRRTISGGDPSLPSW